MGAQHARQGLGPRRVVTAVQNHQRLLAQYLDAGREPGGLQAAQNGFVGNLVALAPQSQSDLHRHGRVAALVHAQEGQLHLVASIGEGIGQRLGLVGQIQILRLGLHQLRLLADALRHDGLLSLGVLQRIANHGAAGLDDARLLLGDGFQRVAQHLGVVQVDAGDGRHQGVVHPVAGVIFSAHTGLQHRQVALLLIEPEQCRRGDRSELHRLLVQLCGGSAHLARHLFQRIRRDHLAVDLHPFPEVQHIGRDGQTGLIPGFL